MRVSLRAPGLHRHSFPPALPRILRIYTPGGCEGASSILLGMSGRLKTWSALVLLALAAPGCNSLCREGAYCSNNFRVDCRDSGEIWGGNDQTFTDCGRFTCVDLGRDAKCVIGAGKDPKCPADGIHDLCDGATYYRCELGYRTAQKDCKDPNICVPGAQGCVLSAERCTSSPPTCSGNYLLLCKQGYYVQGIQCQKCDSGSCTQDAPGCSMNKSPYVCLNDVLWKCDGDRLSFHSDCGRIGLRCNAELGECALP